MSIGNLKDQGNKGNNFPYQLRNLQLLDAINQSVIANGTPTVTVNATATLPPVALDSFGRQRVSSPYTLFDSSYRYADNGQWATRNVSGGTAAFDAGEGTMLLKVDGSLGSTVYRETIKVFSYQPGKSLLVMDTFVMNPELVGLRQRVGYFSTNNGYYLELADTKTFLVERSYVTGSVVNNAIPQGSWNYDNMDGLGPSGITLDLTKSQILWLDMEWLGVGSVRMGFVIDGVFYICHIFHHANILNTTYITTASLPLRYEIENTGATGVSSTLRQICSTVISEGGYELRGTQQSIGTPITSARTFAAAGTYYPIVSLRLKATRLDAIVIATAASILGIGNGKNYQWRVVAGATTTGGAWVSAGADSAVEYNLTGTSTSFGRILGSGYVNSSNQGSPAINILKQALFTNQLERNTFSSTAYEITLEVAVGTTSGGEGVFASVDWEEVSR